MFYLTTRQKIKISFTDLVPYINSKLDLSLKKKASCQKCFVIAKNLDNTNFVSSHPNILFRGDK